MCNIVEFLGFAAFLLIVFNIALNDKVKKLKEDVRIIKNSVKGEAKMSEILKELEGKRCTLTVNGSSQGLIACEVISVDGEWMKISQVVKNNPSKIKIIRIADIAEVSLVYSGL